MVEYKGVMALCETVEGKLAANATELLGGGRKLADALGQELSGVLIGNEISDAAQEAIRFGADKVYLVGDPLLKDYRTDAFLLASEKVIHYVMPQIVIMGHTSMGRDLAPGLAFKLGTGAILDCIEITVEPIKKQLLYTKPVFGGNFNAVITCETYPHVTTVRAKTMSPSEPDDSRQGSTITIDVGIDPLAIRTRVLEKIPEEVEGIKPEDAHVVVAGGRGIGGAKDFKQLYELAKILKGAVGASRPACDNNWAPSGIMIGLTGKIISPYLYIAVAISGSSQHMSGCRTAKNIIAINKDIEANIFREAHFGVVGDWKKVLPSFTNKIMELLAE
jgi:electron transfer flavoprotein alpha subunit